MWFVVGCEHCAAKIRRGKDRKRDSEMGIYGEGGSNAPPEPVLGHPVYPPPNPYTHQGGPYAPQPSYDHMPAQAPIGGPPMVIPTALTGEWTTDLCGCCSDCDLCCQTCWCPCVSFGQITEVLDEGRSSCFVQGTIYALLCTIGVPCVYSYRWRQRLRRKYMLEKGCCGDFCLHCCCGWCAICQEHRELQNRGLDPSLGWEVAQQNYVRPMVAPTAPGVMLR